jgi:hypothetical protein
VSIMTEIEGSTPIFDSIAAVRGYEPAGIVPYHQVYRGPHAGAESYLEASRPDSAKGLAYVTESIHPLELDKQNVTFEEYIHEFGKKFTRRHPKVPNAVVTWVQDLDGSITVTALEQKKAEAKSFEVMPLSEKDQEEKEKISDMMTEMIDLVRKKQPLLAGLVSTQTAQDILAQVNSKPDTVMVQLKKHVEDESIGEDIADTLYMKPPIWGTDEE